MEYASQKLEYIGCIHNVVVSSSIFLFLHAIPRYKRNQYLCANSVLWCLSCIIIYHLLSRQRMESKASHVRCMRITFRCEITYTLVPFITQLDLFNIQLVKTCLDCHIKCPMSPIRVLQPKHAHAHTYLFIYKITKHHLTQQNFGATISPKETNKPRHTHSVFRFFLACLVYTFPKEHKYKSGPLLFIQVFLMLLTIQTHVRLCECLFVARKQETI